MIHQQVYGVILAPTVVIHLGEVFQRFFRIGSELAFDSVQQFRMQVQYPPDRQITRVVIPNIGPIIVIRIEPSIQKPSVLVSYDDLPQPS